MALTEPAWLDGVPWKRYFPLNPFNTQLPKVGGVMESFCNATSTEFSGWYEQKVLEQL